MLSCTVLVPLAKSDGGVRPIAVGELLYRLCAKLILAQLKPDECLLPTQLGVGSPGGVEPIVAAVEKLSKSELGDFNRVTSLDFSNAFNCVSRSAMASAIFEHCPHAYGAAKWRYGQPSTAVVRGKDGVIQQVQVSQGVAQGDPLAPFFFSLAARPVLSALQEYVMLKIDSSVLLVAYLDDIYIFSDVVGVKNAAIRYFDRKPITAGLQLNASKCSAVGRSTLNSDGYALLGSFVGPAQARRQFLKQKINIVEEKLTKLEGLQFQDRHAVLHHSLQHELRHLLRSLNPEDLDSVWHTYDNLLFESLIQLRQPSGLVESPLAKEVAQLPIRMGGMGLPRATLISSAARSASEAASSLIIQEWLSGTPEDRSSQAPPLSQRTLMRPQLEDLRTTSFVTGKSPTACDTSGE